MSHDLLFLMGLFWFVTLCLGAAGFWGWWNAEKRADHAERVNAGLYKLLADRTGVADDALVMSQEIARIEREALVPR